MTMQKELPTPATKYVIVPLTGNANSTLCNSVHWVEGSWTYPGDEEELEKASDFYIFRSRMPYDMALSGIRANNPYRYIYIAKNPKDVCASYRHIDGGKPWSDYYDGDFDHWLRMFGNDRLQRGD